MKKGYQTLHCHTKISDGLLTHLEVLNVCKNNNIDVVAFTDHDGVPDADTVKKLQGQNLSTKWIIGIEMSSSFPQDLIKVHGGPHIVGLFVDPFNKKLKEFCQISQEARVKRMKQVVKNLKSLGFEITIDACLKKSQGVTVGLPHIVAALKSKKKNLDLIEKLRKKMERDSKKDSKIKIKYDEMMDRGETQYPYVLFLSSGAYVKGIHVDYIFRPDWDKNVSLIRNSGGLAFLAHWFTEMKWLKKEILEELLKKNRLDGVETVYGFYDNMEGAFNKQRKTLRKLLKKYKKLESGGVDAHTREHLESFSKDKWFASLTVGMAEKIVKNSGVDTTWSSL